MKTLSLKTKFLFSFTILVLLASSFVDFLSIYELKFLYTVVDETNKQKINWNQLYIIIGIWIAAWLCKIIAKYLQDITSSLIQLDLRTRVTKQFVNLDYSESVTREVGQVANHYTVDVPTITGQVYTTLFSFIGIIASAISYSAALLSISWVLFLILLGFAFLLYIVSNLLYRKFNKAILEYIQNYGIYVNGLMSTLLGMKIFYFGNKMKNFKEKISSTYKLDKTNYNKFTKIYGVVDIPLKMFVVLFSASILAAVVYLYVNGGLNIANVILMSSVSEAFISLVISSGIYFGQIKNGNYLNKQFDYNQKEFVEMKELEKISEISLKDIDISIGDRKIIQKFNYEFQQNKKYLITGKSGVGKSTLLKAIVGIVDIENGDLLANKIKINQTNFLSFRDKVDYIDQNIYLFNQSLAYNIALSNDYDLNKIYEILDSIGLEKVKSILENVIDNNQHQLSGGEKQRIALARALYNQKQILILDESTANLDPNTKNEIEKLVLSQKEKTVIMVSHNFTEENKKLIDNIIDLSQL